jgi:hypothetical protein
MATAHDASAFAQFSVVPGWGTSGDGFGRFSVVKLHLDWAEIKAGLGVAIDCNADDTIKVWDIPANVHVLSVLLKVTTASTNSGTATVEVGDTTTPAGWLAETSIKTATDTGTLISDAYGVVGGKMYSTARIATDATIILTMDGTETDLDLGDADLYLICTFL